MLSARSHPHPKASGHRAYQEGRLEDEGHDTLSWRNVGTDGTSLGKDRKRLLHEKQTF